MPLKISIVIPVYNVASYLSDCLDSVLAQTYVNWEAICVDDGSTDGCSSVLDEYASKDSRIKVIHQVNSGVSAARNQGLQLATGEWVLFMDSDDVITQDALKIISEQASVADHDVVMFEMQRVKSFLEPIRNVAHCQVVVHNMANLEDAVPLIRRIYPDRLWAWNKCMRRSLIGGLRFEDYQPCEDAVFVLSCLTSARKVVVLPHVLYKYLQHENSCLARITPKRINGDIHGMTRLTDVLLDWQYGWCLKKEARAIACRFRDSLFDKLQDIKADNETLEDLRNKYGSAVKDVFCKVKLFGLLRAGVYRIIFVCGDYNEVSSFYKCKNRWKKLVQLPQRVSWRVRQLFKDRLIFCRR